MTRKCQEGKQDMFTWWLFYTLLYFAEFCIIFEQFMTVNLSQTVRNIPVGYFEGIYTCENFTFLLQTEKYLKCLSEMMHTFLENRLAEFCIIFEQFMTV
jgi:hypothetical protein